MPAWIEQAAARRPERVALEGPERTLSYAQLLGEARVLARRLARAGARPGARVAVELPPGEEFVVALHACDLLGAGIMPIDLRLAEAERARRRAGAALCLSGALREAFGGGEAAAAGEAAAEGAPEVHSVAAPGEGAHASASQPDRGGSDSLALAVMHTSGTTADPKRIELTRGNFLHSALASAAMLGLDPDERWLCPMPLTHVGGLSIAIRSAIYATTAVLHGRFETNAVLAELMDPARRITLVSLVPTMLQRLLDAGLRRPPTLRYVLLGGGPIPGALLDRAAAAEVPVAPTYGMTEACSQIATFGLPLPGVEVRVGERLAGVPAVHSDGVEAARGAAAEEILVRGPVVASGALAADGWLHTGDLGTIDEAGRLRVAGRSADTVISGGENVSPAEVEAVLLEHPDVADAAVHGRADPEWGEIVVATVVLRDGAQLLPERLRAFCAERLARYKVPKQIAFADSLPRTPSGKLLRRELC
jgi:O-succinylbenzoic acid--CoA ligase